MQVIIGVDPHKASHTAVAISSGEDELARKKVRASTNQVPELLAWAEPFPSRDICRAPAPGSCLPGPSCERVRPRPN